MQSVTRETELKLAFDPADAGRLKRQLGSSFGVKPRRQTLVSVYFDTPDQVLRKAGVSLRVRRIGRSLVQTIKSGNNGSNVVFERGEWERNVGVLQPDLSAAEGTPLAPLLDGRGAEALRPVFESRIRRTVYEVGRENSNIVLAVDQGEIDNGTDRTPICELELELKRGEPAELFELARRLSEVVPLRFAVHSKSERGYALGEDKSDQVERASDVHLAGTMTCADAFRVIAFSGLRQLAANSLQVAIEMPDALHQMRIGLRRVRAAMSVFKDIVKDEERNGIRDELKWLTKVLATARDLDVFAAEVLTVLQDEYPSHVGLAAISAEIEQRRFAAYAEIETACRSDRYRALMLAAAEWIESGPWRTNEDPLLQARREQPVATLAADELARRRRKIAKSGKHLRDCSPHDRHKVRIRVKKLRYATEFFADVFASKRSDRRRDDLSSALKDLQDALGGLNDIDTRIALITQIAQDNLDGVLRTERAFVAGMIVGRQDAQRKHLLDAAEKAYDDVTDCKPFWT